MQKWEYKVVKRVDVSENGLNELGADGWELMNFVLPQCNIPGSFDEIDVELVLRRPVQGRSWSRTSHHVGEILEPLQ